MIETADVIHDEALTQGLAANVDGCFEHLVMAYQDRLYAFALRLSNSAQDAEEITQDAFVRAYRALASYAPSRRKSLTLRPWLYQITLNVFRNRVRGRHATLVPLDELTSRSAEPAGDAQAQPEAVFERAERAHELNHLVAALPERYRVALILRHIADLSYAEIAALLEQPIGTVKANVHRGVRLLRETYDQPATEVC